MRYWVYINNEIVGPFEKEKLAGLQGFSANTLICVETPIGAKTADWQTAGTLPEIAVLLPAMPTTHLKGALESAPQQPAQEAKATPPAEEFPSGNLPRPAAPEPSVSPANPDEYVPAPLPGPSEVYAAPEPLKPPEPVTSAPVSRAESIPRDAAQNAEFQKAVKQQLDEIAKNTAGLKDRLQAKEDEVGKLRQDIFGKILDFETTVSRLEKSVRSMGEKTASAPPGPQTQAAPEYRTAPEFTPQPEPAPPAAQIEKISDLTPARSKPEQPKPSKSRKPLIIAASLVSLAAAAMLFLGKTGKTPAPEKQQEAAGIESQEQSQLQKALETMGKEVVEWVKSYSAQAGSIEKLIEQAHLSKNGPPSIDWKSEAVSPGFYSVTAAALSKDQGAAAVTYRFEADYQNRTVKGASPEARTLLEPPAKQVLPRKPAAPAPRKPAAKAAAAKAKTAPAVKLAPKEEEEFEYEEVEEEVEEEPEKAEPAAKKSLQSDFILPGIPRNK